MRLLLKSFYYSYRDLIPKNIKNIKYLIYVFTFCFISKFIFRKSFNYIDKQNKNKVRFYHNAPVLVIPLENLNLIYLAFVISVIIRYYGNTCCLSVPQEYIAKVANKNQLNADRILSLLTLFRTHRHSRALAVTNQDMAGRYHHWLFGYGHLSQKVAVISLNRIIPKKYDKSEKTTIYSRIYVNILHELGHTVGIPHCLNKCIMQPIHDLCYLDKTSLSFCHECLKFFKIVEF